MLVILKAILLSALLVNNAWAAGDPNISTRLVHDIQGHNSEIKDYVKGSKYLVLIFHTVGCPVLRRSYPSIDRLARRFRGEVSLVMVNSSMQDSISSIRQNLKDFPIKVPVVKDSHQEILRDLGVTTSATAVVINTEKWIVEYEGAISDQFTYSSSSNSAQNEFLATALSSLLAGQPVLLKHTKVFGCLITPDQARYQ